MRLNKRSVRCEWLIIVMATTELTPSPLTSLFPEILDNITVFLGPVDLFRLCCTSKYFFDIIHTSRTWTRVLHQLASREKVPPAIELATHTGTNNFEEVKRITCRERNWRKCLVTGVRCLSARTDGISQLATDGSALGLMGVASNYVQLWRLPKLVLEQEFLAPIRYRLVSIAVSIESNVIVAGTQAGPIYIWNITKLTPAPVSTHPTLTPTSKLVPLVHPCCTLRGHTDRVGCLELPCDSTSRLITGSWDRRVIVWDVHTGAKLEEFDTGRSILGLHLHTHTLHTFHTDAHGAQYGFPSFVLQHSHRLQATRKSRARVGVGDRGTFFCASGNRKGVLCQSGSGLAREADAPKQIGAAAVDGGHGRVVALMEMCKNVELAVRVWSVSEEGGGFVELRAAGKEVEKMLRCEQWGDITAVAVIDGGIVLGTEGGDLLMLEFK